MGFSIATYGILNSFRVSSRMVGNGREWSGMMGFSIPYNAHVKDQGPRSAFWLGGVMGGVDFKPKSPLKTLADEQQFPEKLILGPNHILKLLLMNSNSSKS